MCDNRHGWIQVWRLLLQEWIGKTLEDATLAIDSEVSAFRIQQDFNIFSFEPFADEECLAEQMYIAMFCDLAEEGDSASRNGKRFVRDRVIERQLAKLAASAILDRGQAVQAGLHVLRIDRFFQSLQLAFECPKLRIVPLE